MATDLSTPGRCRTSLWRVKLCCMYTAKWYNGLSCTHSLSLSLSLSPSLPLSLSLSLDFLRPTKETKFRDYAWHNYTCPNCKGVLPRPSNKDDLSSTCIECGETSNETSWHVFGLRVWSVTSVELMLVLQKEKKTDLLFIDIRRKCFFNKPSFSLSCSVCSWWRWVVWTC